MTPKDVVQENQSKEASALASLLAFACSEKFEPTTHDKDSIVFKKNSLLFREGDRPDGVFGISSGLVTLSKQGPHGHAQIHTVLAPGDLAGYRSVFANQAYSASATAIELTHVHYFPAPLFLSLAKNHPKILQSLMTRVCTELGVERENWLSRNDHPAETRLARCLLNLRQTVSKNRKGADVASICFPRPNLAAIIGVNPDTVSRLLARLKDKGAIRLRGRRIFFNNMNHLNKAAELGPSV